MRHSAGLAFRNLPPTENSARPKAPSSYSASKAAPLVAAASVSARSLAAMSCLLAGNHDTGTTAGRLRQGRRRPALPKGLVGLLPQEGGDVVLVHAALLQRLNRRGAVAADYRRYLVELLVVHGAREVVRSGFLGDNQLGLRLSRRARRAEARRHHCDAQVLGQPIVVHAAVDD